jgi:predicted DNA-binding ribbon-helix-helix protein
MKHTGAEHPFDQQLVERMARERNCTEAEIVAWLDESVRAEHDWELDMFRRGMI